MRLHIVFTAIFIAGKVFMFISTLAYFDNNSVTEELVAMLITNVTNCVGQVMLFKIMYNLNFNTDNSLA